MFLVFTVYLHGTEYMMSQAEPQLYLLSFLS